MIEDSIITNPVFVTERLDAFCFKIAYFDGDTGERCDREKKGIAFNIDVWLAFERDDWDYPHPAVIMTTWGGFYNQIIFIETCEPFREHGYAKEFGIGWQKHFNCSLDGTACTNAGAALLDSWMRDWKRYCKKKKDNDSSNK